MQKAERLTNDYDSIIASLEKAMQGRIKKRKAIKRKRGYKIKGGD